MVTFVVVANIEWHNHELWRACELSELKNSQTGAQNCNLGAQNLPTNITANCPCIQFRRTLGGWPPYWKTWNTGPHAPFSRGVGNHSDFRLRAATSGNTPDCRPQANRCNIQTTQVNLVHEVLVVVLVVQLQRMEDEAVKPGPGLIFHIRERLYTPARQKEVGWRGPGCSDTLLQGCMPGSTQFPRLPRRGGLL